MSNNQVTASAEQQTEIQTYNDNMMMDIGAMTHMMNVATFMANGTATLPEEYRGNPANCLAVVMQAAQWKMNPFAIAQKTHFVSGKIGYEAQLVSAVIQQSGVIQGMFKFDWFGPWENIVGKFIEKESKKTDDHGYPKKYKAPAWKFEDEEGVGIKVSATLKGETEPRELTLLLKQATTRNSTLWADDPKQQIAYLAQKRWARLYAPGVILGVYTADELEATAPIEKEINPAPAAQPNQPQGATIDPAREEYINGLIRLLEQAASAGEATFRAEWKRIGKANRQDAYDIGQVEFSRLEQLAIEADAKRPPEQPPMSSDTSDFVSEMEAAEGK